MNFDWDPTKSRLNYRKHGITFDEAQAVFADPERVDDYDDRDYEEDRWIVIGRVGPLIVYVVYADRDGIIRLISARKAAPHEEARYHSRHLGG